MFKYIRLRFLGMLLKPTQVYFRRKRMSQLIDFIDSFSGRRFRVLDLGGQPEIWSYIDHPLEIEILNLPGVARKINSNLHKISYIEGDACDLSCFLDKEFDLVFSNSVIEHVGNESKIEAFCYEACRVGKRIWIQTPSKYFPLEPHTGMPFWWYYPEWLKRYFINGWRAKLPAWTEMVEGTRCITKADLYRLLPNCSITVERFMGLPKSYIAKSESPRPQ